MVFSILPLKSNDNDRYKKEILPVDGTLKRAFRVTIIKCSIKMSSQSAFVNPLPASPTLICPHQNPGNGKAGKNQTY